jgi:chemotaxis protein CheZ
VQRKVFRIEEMMSSRRRVASGSASSSSSHGDERDGKVLKQLSQEFAALRDMIAWSKREIAVLRADDAGERPLPRAADELNAAISGMEGATDKILKAAEIADEAARNLRATLREDYNRGLAQDIQDQVVQIYEACNFQDLAGQRITKAIGTLQMVEARLARVSEIWGGVEDMARRARSASTMLNGPKLDGDIGHAEQSEIDRLFA